MPLVDPLFHVHHRRPIGFVMDAKAGTLQAAAFDHTVMNVEEPFVATFQVHIGMVLHYVGLVYFRKH